MSLCVFCKNGQVTGQLQPMSFRQWSDKGHVECQVMVMVQVCGFCGMKTLDDGADKIMNDAFQREYDKLRGWPQAPKL